MILREYPSYRALNPIIYTTPPISTNPSSISDQSWSKNNYLNSSTHFHHCLSVFDKTKKILIVEALYGLAHNQHLARESPLLGSAIYFTNQLEDRHTFSFKFKCSTDCFWFPSLIKNGRDHQSSSQLLSPMESVASVTAIGRPARCPTGIFTL